ncbi:glycosyltransferase family 61 protein [Roseomonas chloroacetimidivorans]|uniref:glycosyltransferase family 61 protein n=1 Tax=Roseomonas chloroacetimidivorans TaxID=1766656 RepID=UPI003C70A381
MRLGIYQNAVVLGGGAIIDPFVQSIVVESLTGASDGIMSRPNDLSSLVRYFDMEIDGEVVRQKNISPHTPKRLEGDYFHLTYRSDMNYTHFMLEVLPRIHYWLLLPEPRPRILVSDHVAKHLHELLSLYGIRPDTLVVVPPPRGRPLEVERLFLGSAPMWGHASALGSVRRIADDMMSGSRRILVLRKGRKSWFRKLLNEQKIIAFLSSLNFESVVLEDLRLAEQVKLFQQAGYVAGIYGGGLFNTIFSLPGTAVLSMTSSDYHRTILDSLPEPLSLRGTTVVGESFSSKIDRNNSPFVIDMQALAAACHELGL